MTFFTKEVKIALVAIAAIVVLFIGMNFLKGISVFSSNDIYYVRFNDVSGMAASSPVYANGYRVGVVKSIEFDFESHDGIIAAIDLDPRLTLHEGTHAEIVSDLLGNVKLELRLGSDNGKTLHKGDTIIGSMQEGLMSKAAEMLPQVQQMLPKLDSIVSNIQTLTGDPALAATIGNAEQLTAALNTTAGQLNRLTAQLNQQMPQMLQKANGVLDNTQTLTANMSQMDIAATLLRIDSLLANIQQLTAAMNSNDGTLGMLLNDAQLYQNLNSTMRSVDSLLTDFKKHPKRYINVSVFGKKDK